VVWDKVKALSSIAIARDTFGEDRLFRRKQLLVLLQRLPTRGKFQFAVEADFLIGLRFGETGN
jgi:hypothetical protein